MTQPAASTEAAPTEAEVRATVEQLVQEMAPDSEGFACPPPPDARLVEDLGYHSLALLEFAFALEDEFDLPPIDEETARAILTVGAVQDHVVGILRERGRLGSDTGAAGTPGAAEAAGEKGAGAAG
ncbi:MULTISPECIES: hypothetical protein [unclassified Streptomyces]|uniref:hypothetical protein n=1 Tax=unclassified Streptomyces TaxID=2593676 RepID=UPI0003810932|nr:MULTISPECIES: hypothetical protein [unclassified Streptomyces]